MSEPIDRNKSALTHVATASVAAWMNTIGVKAVEAEVRVGQSWVADLAGVWEPTYTELRRTHAFKRLEWLRGVADGSRLNLFYNVMGSPITVLVEVKVTRADFLSDAKRKYGWKPKLAYRPAPAHLRIVACPNEIVRNDEVMGLANTGWGVLRLSAACDRVISGVDAFPYRLNAVLPGDLVEFMNGLLTALDHRTRYARLRMWHKSYRAGGA